MQHTHRRPAFGGLLLPGNPSFVRNFAPFFVLCLAVFLLSAKQTACRKTEETGVEKPATEVLPASVLVKKLPKQTHSDVRTLTARAQLFVDNEGQTISASANIIWIRDSVVWINVKKFGIEAARALITRDSVFILNRLERTYTAQGLETMLRQYNLPEGFALLQATLLGSAWFFPDITLQSGIESGFHQMKGSNGRYSAEYSLAGGSFLLRKESFFQIKDARVVSMAFDQYKNMPVLGQFPYLRTVEAFSPETGKMKIDIDFSSIEVNKQAAYRFEVPASYERTK